jgi:RimJ/RimL family protein N-acetyltransferase
MSINPTYGTVEIGGILWGPKISRTRITTEAFYLFTCHIFDDLHYRRYEWKCNNDNIPSKNAALRFGFQFEGIFRQHLIQQGWNRDTTYFSMLDKEWPNVKRSLELWLSEENFDEYGQQIRTLRSFQEELNNK